MSDRRRVTRCLATSLTVVALFVSIARPAEAQRTWTTLASGAMEYPARDIEKGTPMGRPGGPDAPVRKTFQIPSRGLIRVTVWVLPYYPGGSVRDPNTGGAGLMRRGDGAALGAPYLWQASIPSQPIDGAQYMTSAVGEVDAHPAAWIELTPAVSSSGWAQLKFAVRALVEFSPGGPQPGETFAAPSTPPGGAPPPEPPAPAPKAIVTPWAVVANGYPATLEFTWADYRLTARIYYEATKTWETLTDVAYDKATQTISFTRPWPGKPTFQKYRGRVEGARIVGTFTDENSPGREFPWSATR